MIECEVQSHDAYGTSPELFATFFQVIVDTLRDVVADKWPPEMEVAWQRLLGELRCLTSPANVSRTAVSN